MKALHSGKTYHLYYSRWRAWLLLLVGLPFGVYSLVVVVAARYVIGNLSLLPIPILVVAYGHLAYRAIDRIRRTEPVVSFDSVGITDRRERDAPIPWTAIRDMYIGPFGGSTSLLIAFRTNEDAERSLGRPLFLDGALTKAENLIIAPGAAWGIQLGQLRCSPTKVLGLAKSLKAAATRAQQPRPGSQR